MSIILSIHGADRIAEVELLISLFFIDLLIMKSIIVYSNNLNVHAIISKSLIINVDLRIACLTLNSVGHQTRAGHLWLVLCARIYIYPVFRENKSKTLVFTHMGFFAKTRSINSGTEINVQYCRESHAHVNRQTGNWRCCNCSTEYWDGSFKEIKLSRLSEAKSAKV